MPSDEENLPVENYSSQPVYAGMNSPSADVDTSPSRVASIDAAMTEFVSGDEPIAERVESPQATAWVTATCVLICVGIFLGLHVHGDPTAYATLRKFGWLPADAIWGGGYWGLVTAAFVHYYTLHLVLNIGALWALGSRLERAIGPLATIVFYTTSAFVSSAYQLALSEQTGVGISGVVYAVFGFMWLARWRYPEFHRVIDERMIRSFLMWFVGCILLTHFDVLPIGNGAHGAGLVFGVLVATYFARRQQKPLVLVGLVALIAMAIVPLFWAPWSAQWLSYQGDVALQDNRYEEAITWYSQSLDIVPDDPYSLWHRGVARTQIGELKEAAVDLQRAREILPQLGRPATAGPKQP